MVITLTKTVNEIDLLVLKEVLSDSLVIEEKVYYRELFVKVTYDNIEDIFRIRFRDGIGLDGIEEVIKMLKSVWLENAVSGGKVLMPEVAL